MKQFVQNMEEAHRREDRLTGVPGAGPEAGSHGHGINQNDSDEDERQDTDEDEDEYEGDGGSVMHENEEDDDEEEEDGDVSTTDGGDEPVSGSLELPPSKRRRL